MESFRFINLYNTFQMSQPPELVNPTSFSFHSKFAAVVKATRISSATAGQAEHCSTVSTQQHCNCNSLSKDESTSNVVVGTTKVKHGHEKTSKSIIPERIYVNGDYGPSKLHSLWYWRFDTLYNIYYI